MCLIDCFVCSVVLKPTVFTIYLQVRAIFLCSNLTGRDDLI